MGEGLYDPDPVLGWIHRAGSYRLRPPFLREGHLLVTFGADGRRETGAPLHDQVGEIIVIGDSFTEGWALSDSDTFPWKLQERFPSFSVLNYGTGAYGTYQSLLMLERILPSVSMPVAVVYGFFHHHPERNVAEAGWLEGLDRFSDRHRVGLPYVSLDEDGELVGHGLEYYPRFPLRRVSALVTMMEKAWARVRNRHRADRKEDVTRALLLRMNELSQERGAKFYFVPLSAPEGMKRRYTEFLDNRGIRSIDCSIHPFPDDLTIPGEGHPNGLANTMWAECIGGVLDKELEHSR